MPSASFQESDCPDFWGLPSWWRRSVPRRSFQVRADWRRSIRLRSDERSLTRRNGREPSTKDMKEIFLFGLVLSFVHVSRCVLRQQNVLAFPLLQRHRFYRMKQAFLENVADGMLCSVLGTSIFVLMESLISMSFHPISITRTLILLHVGWFLCFCWETAGSTVDVVLTEYLCFGDVSPEAASQTAHNEALLKQIQEKDDLASHLAFWDLACLAGERGPGGWRQRLIFDDETGHVWKCVAEACFVPLNEMMRQLSTQLKKVRRDLPSRGSVAKQWNTHYMFSAHLPDRAAAMEGVCAIEAGYQKSIWAAETISVLVAEAKTKDTFGVVQLSEFNIARVVKFLVSGLCIVESFIAQYSMAFPEPGWLDGFTGRNFIRWILANKTDERSSRSAEFGYKNSIDSVCYALHDSLQTCVYRIVDAYGAELQNLVTQGSTRSESLSQEVVLTKLQKLLEYTE